MLDTAIVLAAGEGTRLRPLTDSVPKVMMPIAGEPLLFRTLAHLAAQGIRNVGINLHHLGDVIAEAVGDGSRFGVKVTYSHEESLLGSAGALHGFGDLLAARRFAILYGDMLTDADLGELDRFHHEHGAVLTMALMKSEDPTRCGVVGTNHDGRVTSFVEKPETAEPEADVNAGLYVCEAQILDAIPAGRSDFGSDVIPSLIASGQKVYGLRTRSHFQDIGTPELLRLAEASIIEGEIACRS